jgi:cytochrome c553
LKNIEKQREIGMAYWYHHIGSAALVMMALSTVSSRAAEAPTSSAETATPPWAYPVNPPAETFDDAIELQVPGSTLTFTRGQIESDFAPPDWHPDDHAPLPDVVASGRQPAVRACMKCHLTNGLGHPESSDLAGLSIAYIQQQIAEFANGNRNGARAASMIPIAKAITAEEVLAAAQYYSSLPPVVEGWRKVLETSTVPQTYLGTGGMRFVSDNGGVEPIGERIIELPQNPMLAERRDSRSGFTANVPLGSLAKGESLVTTGGGKTLPCGTCHGADLRGNSSHPELRQAFGEAPNLAGRSPMYVFRQLNDFKLGTRKGPSTALMQSVVANLDQGDMVAIAAYLATLE